MKTFRLLPPTLVLAGLTPFAAMPAAAQEVVQPLPGTTDADALADDMRRLATNPRDVDSLVDAARLSLRLDDMRAAASLLQRAENVDPRNPKIKAGQGSVLVQSERPGQALRYFAEAEAQGLSASSFVADRGLAYDLTGEQERAQRDYARALRDHPNDDETIRRYALSLGISGQRQRAIALLDPLVRKSDRAAWRAQAFVLAMTGDVAGASRIAATMMPGGASGLSAFFQRLPTLSPIDRAFAVHFGEIRATPERLADARLAPPLGLLPRDTGTALASNQLLPSPQPRRERSQARPAATASTALAAATPAPVTAALGSQPRRENLPTIASARTTPISPASAPVTLAAARQPAAGTPLTTAAPRSIGSAQVATSTPTPASSLSSSIGTSATSLAVSPASTAPVQIAAVTPRPSPIPQAPVSTAPIAAAPAPVQEVAVPPSAPTAAIVRPAEPPRSSASARVSEDSILARIVASLSIPASELGVEGPERPDAGAEPARQEPPGRLAAALPAKTDAAAVEKARADEAADAKLAAAKAAADKKAAARKAAVDKKALAEKKAAAEQKALADKEAAEKKKAERASPERIWVQVAGGAYEGDLPKAYAAVKAKAPAVFGSRGGWTTPLRATNRVLTGPFKTDAEARQFVNDLKKEGVPAFTFTSDAGQPVARLGAKGKAAADEPDDKPAGKPSSTKSKRRR